jgi:hypothetical protein
VNFDITLEPLRGDMIRGGVTVTVEHDLYQIFVSGSEGSEEAFKQAREGRSRELIGFVGKQPGAPINFHRVVLAFGDHTAKLFTAMVRQALMTKARERIEVARAAAKEAEAMAEQAKALLEEQKALELEESDALAAKQLAELAMAEAYREMESAEYLAAKEDATVRPAATPDRAVVNAILAEGKQAKREPGPDTVGDLADLQNL